MLKFRLTRDKKHSHKIPPEKPLPAKPPVANSSNDPATTTGLSAKTQKTKAASDPHTAAGTTLPEASSVPSRQIARPEPSGIQASVKPGAVPSKPFIALEMASKPTSSDVTSPSLLAPPPNLMGRPSKGFLGALSNRIRPSHTDSQSPTSPSDNRSRPTPPLPNDFTSKARREEALRARGLLPPIKVKDLSRLEAEENRRLPAASPSSETPSEAGPSAARAIMDSWRAQNESILQADDIAGTEENQAHISSSPNDPEPMMPPRPTHQSPLASPATPPKPVSHRPAGPRISPPHSPQGTVTQSRPSQEGHVRSTSEADSTEKVSLWLQQSPGRSPTKRTKHGTSEDSTRERLTNFTMPRSPTVATSPATAQQEPSKATQTTLSLSPSSYKPPSPSPSTPELISRTLLGSAALLQADSPDMPTTPTSPTIPSLVESSSQLSHSTSSDHASPEVPSSTFQLRNTGAKRGRPAGVSPIIVESPEEGILRDEPHIPASTAPFLAQDFGAFNDSQTASPLVSTFPAARPRPPRADVSGGKKTENRKSLGFVLGKKRGGTLQPEPFMSKSSSLGNLRRAVTNAGTRSKPLGGGRGGGGARPQSIVETPAEPLSPTMHSQGSILLGMKSIEDEESRRLSEMAFML